MFECINDAEENGMEGEDGGKQRKYEGRADKYVDEEDEEYVQNSG